MSNITIKMEVTAAEFNQLSDMLRERWDEAASSLRSERSGYLEYRSREAIENGEPEQIGGYYVRTATSAVPKLRAMANLVNLFGLDREIDEDKVALLEKVQKELEAQEAAQDTSAQITN